MIQSVGWVYNLLFTLEPPSQVSEFQCLSLSFTFFHAFRITPTVGLLYVFSIYRRPVFDRTGFISVCKLFVP